VEETRTLTFEHACDHNTPVVQKIWVPGHMVLKVMKRPFNWQNLDVNIRTEDLDQPVTFQQNCQEEYKRLDKQNL
jgi:hypothetical protein